MRTAEEIKEWIIGHYPKGLKGEITLRLDAVDLLKFIDSDPPCKHARCQYAAGWPTGNWYFYPYSNPLAKIKFCPDCGQELEVEQ